MRVNLLTVADGFSSVGAQGALLLHRLLVGNTAAGLFGILTRFPNRLVPFGLDGRL